MVRHPWTTLHIICYRSQSAGIFPPFKDGQFWSQSTSFVGVNKGYEVDCRRMWVSFKTPLMWTSPSSQTAPFHCDHAVCDRWGQCQQEPRHEKLGSTRSRPGDYSLSGDGIYLVSLCYFVNSSVQTFPHSWDIKGVAVYTFKLSHLCARSWQI